MYCNTSTIPYTLQDSPTLYTTYYIIIYDHIRYTINNILHIQHTLYYNLQYIIYNVLDTTI